MALLTSEIAVALGGYLREISRIYHINKAILFGSVAQGKATVDSDLDLALFSDQATEDNRLTMTIECLMHIVPYHLDIQPIVFPYADYLSRENDFIRDEILAKGVEIEFSDQVSVGEI
jgi:predicted nucleotidyltransferase